MSLYCRSLLRLWPLTLTACTGLSLGQNLPGTDA